MEPLDRSVVKPTIEHNLDVANQSRLFADIVLSDIMSASQTNFSPTIRVTRFIKVSDMAYLSSERNFRSAQTWHELLGDADRTTFTVHVEYSHTNNMLVINVSKRL